MDATQYLCSKCISIFEPGSYEPWKALEHVASRPESRYLHESSKSLRESLVKGCWMCKFIDQGVRESNRPRDDAVTYTLKVSAAPQFDFDIEFRADRSTSDAYLQSFNIVRQAGPPSVLDAAEFSKLQTWTGHEAVLNLLVEWIQACGKEHKTCIRRTGFTPTRLLDVNQEAVRLVDSNQETIQHEYTTLSHCWGQRAFFRLTPSTMDQLRHGVALGDFPMSFQHAILITRRLHVRYIWIDCYCIIQGDDSLAQRDWEVESIKMGEVYGNSLLNIGAGHATDPHMGIFRNRPPNLVRSMSLEWQPTNNERPARFSIMPRDQFDAQLGDFLKTSLYKRGWVLQESVLSPRMVTFAEDRIFWQCRESKLACEDFPNGPPEEEEERAVRKLLPFWSMETTQTTNLKAKKDALALNWFQLVTSYCNTALSFPDKDKLRAFDGVAHTMAKCLGESYSNGMLESLIPTGLLWNCPRTSTKLSSERAPSWHWASVDGSIGYYEAEGRFRLSASRSYLAPSVSVCLPDAAINMSLPTSTVNNWRPLIFIGKLMKINAVVRHPTTGANGATHWSAMWDYLADVGNCKETMELTMDSEIASQRFVLCHRILPIQFADYVRCSTFRQRNEAMASKDKFNLQGLVLASAEDGCWRRVGICSVNKEFAHRFGGHVSDRMAFMRELAGIRPQCLLIK